MDKNGGVSGGSGFSNVPALEIAEREDGKRKLTFTMLPEEYAELEAFARAENSNLKTMLLNAVTRRTATRPSPEIERVFRMASSIASSLRCLYNRYDDGNYGAAMRELEEICDELWRYVGKLKDGG